MRIVIIGAGGQVGSEVSLRLAAVRGFEVVPVIRSRSGSAFLRSAGLPVLHGDVTDPSFARRCFERADLIANFALAGGTPRQARRQNEALGQAVIDHSDSRTPLVFVSSLAIHGDAGPDGRRRVSPYGKLKRQNEQFVAAHARAAGRKAYVLRLGHVAGTLQGITELCHEELRSPPIVLPDPDRPSNVVHVVTVVDALLAIADGRSGPPGTYDLVNVPQWTWREVYEHEAAHLGLAASFECIDSRTQGPLSKRAMRVLTGALRTARVKDRLLTVLSALPGSVNERIRSEYYVDRVVREVAALEPAREVRNTGAYWPALETHTLSGLSSTRDLLSSAPPDLAGDRPRWPADIVLRNAE